MTAVVALTAPANQSNLEKIESFFNDPLYKEALENSVNYNTRLCIERRLRLPFIDTQTGVAQNHCALFMNKRQRIPGILPGQIYSYPRQRWRKKRRQYLTMNSRAFARAADAMLDGDVDMHNISQIENPALQDTDSKDSQLLKDDVPKEWYYDEQDMLEMDTYDEPDPDSDLDYEETYSKRSTKRRKGAGRGRGGTDSPSTPGRKKGSGRGRKKAGHSFDPTPGDPDKPFACELCGARYKTRPGLTYHYGHSHKEGASDDSRDSFAPNTPTQMIGGGSGNNIIGNMMASLMPPSGGLMIQNMPPGSGPPVLGPPMQSGMPNPGVMMPMLSHTTAALISGGGMGEATVAPSPNPQGPNQGHVYQDSYVSFLNQTPGTPGRRRQQPPLNPGGPLPPNPNMPPIPPPSTSMPLSQTPPTLPPNLPPQLPPQPMDDPQMPILMPEKSLDPSPIMPPHLMQQLPPTVLPGGPDAVSPMPSVLGPPPIKDKAAPSPYCDFCLGDSRENKKTGSVEELVSCSDCGRSGKNKVDLLMDRSNNGTTNTGNSGSKKGRKKKIV